MPSIDSLPIPGLRGGIILSSDNGLLPLRVTTVDGDVKYQVSISLVLHHLMESTLNVHRTRLISSIQYIFSPSNALLCGCAQVAPWHDAHWFWEKPRIIPRVPLLLVYPLHGYSSITPRYDGKFRSTRRRL